MYSLKSICVYCISCTIYCVSKNLYVYTIIPIVKFPTLSNLCFTQNYHGFPSSHIRCSYSCIAFSPNNLCFSSFCLQFFVRLHHFLFGVLVHMALIFYLISQQFIFHSILWFVCHPALLCFLRVGCAGFAWNFCRSLRNGFYEHSPRYERQCTCFAWNFGFRSHFPVRTKTKMSCASY